MRRIAVFLFAFVAAAPAWAQSVRAQEAYPSRTVTLITPYAPGGGSDFLTRTLAEALKTRLNQTVVVQNVAGAGGAVGSMQAAKAKPDGYTLLLNHIGMSTIPLLYKKLNFDPLASYEFIGLFAEAPMVILARKDFAPKDFAELVVYAKANREKLTMASSGMGSATHLCAMLFQEALGVPITMVQYKGAAPAVIDVRSGQVDLLCDLPTTTSSLIRSGDLRAYVLTAPRRMASLPDVPTAGEVGMPSLYVGAWYGFYAPAGTPKPVIEILNKALRDIRPLPPSSRRSRPICCRSTRRRPRRTAASSPPRLTCGGRSSRRRASRRNSQPARGAILSRLRGRKGGRRSEERLMRLVSVGLVTCVLAAGLSGAARADEFMNECLVTANQKMCECISSKMPADKRAAAIAGMRKSNAATQPGGNLLDPSSLTQEQMQGLDAVVIAQASCM